MHQNPKSDLAEGCFGPRRLFLNDSTVPLQEAFRLRLKMNLLLFALKLCLFLMALKTSMLI